MADDSIEYSKLPLDIRAKLAELDLELSEGDITQKGYDKKKSKLLENYTKCSENLTAGGGSSSSTSSGAAPAAGRRHNRRLTREDHRYHSEIRQEAVKKALAQFKHDQKIPMPSKRHSNQAVVGDQARRVTGNNDPPLPTSSRPLSESSSDEDEVFDRKSPPKENRKSNSGHHPRHNYVNMAGSSAQTALSQIMQQSTPPQIPPITDPIESVLQASQPPDVTNNTSSAGSGRLAPHLSSVRGVPNLDLESGDVLKLGRISSKIQNLCETLKKPKRRPLPDYFIDEDEAVLEPPAVDPTAPKPDGPQVVPIEANQLIVPSSLQRRNLESSLHRYGTGMPKSTAISVLDSNGRASSTITYGKLLTRVNKLAYNLLRIGSKSNPLLKPEDTVALVYPNNDALSFVCAFYACLTANLVPVPIEVPLSKRDAGCQNIGFLLGSLNVKVAITSDACHKGLPKNPNGEVITFRGWPRLHWFVSEHLSKPGKDWNPPARLQDHAPAYIEYTHDKDGSVLGVTHTRASMLSHCRALSVAANYTEAETMVCVLDFKRDLGLWHSVLTSVYNGMHVIFIPYQLMKSDPASWLKMVTKYKASIALVKSRDMHWALLATKDHKDINLQSLRFLLVADGSNPWSLTSCDSFTKHFSRYNLKEEAVCPCGSSPEALTICMRRPSRSESSSSNSNTTGRGVLSMKGLSHGVVRVDSESSYTSLALQDCGVILDGASLAIVSIENQPVLCKADEVGELCISAPYTAHSYWGLAGKSAKTFEVVPLLDDGTPAVPNQKFVRSGLLGFVGPEALIFVCGSRDGLMTVGNRRHNTDDIIATVLAVTPAQGNFIYRGRIAVFSIRVLRDERIVIVAEQKPDANEDESFKWMSQVLQAVDAIHNVGVYCLALVPANCLPKTALGGIHVHETRRRFVDGNLHPACVLMSPHTCVTNLPKPREHHPDVGPSAMFVGNIVQGARLAQAQGRELPKEDDNATNNFLSEILRNRAQQHPDHILFTLKTSKNDSEKLTCSQLHKKAERIACVLTEKNKLVATDLVALMFHPGIDLIASFYGCLYAGVVPVVVRPPNERNIPTTLPTAKMVVEVSKSKLLLTNGAVVKLLRSKEASSVVNVKQWPPIVDVDDLAKKKVSSIYRAPNSELTCYVDFSVSTTGMLAGVKISHGAASSLCRAIKLQCELYPAREVCICLDPYCGLGLVLWCLSSIYSGHRSILIPPAEIEHSPQLWLTTLSQNQIRDTFCSYGVMDLCTKGLGGPSNTIQTMIKHGVNLSSLRTMCVIAEERPRIKLMSAFTALFSALKLNPRAVSTSFGCRVNVGVNLQGASSPDPTQVYVDLKALRNDRVALVEKGSPHSLCVLESAKLLPGVKVVIANPETKGQCADSHLGEIWVSSPHNSSGYTVIQGDIQEGAIHTDHFESKLATGDVYTTFARTGYLGFVKRTEMKQSDGERHDALFVLGSLEETLIMRGMRYHPIDIEDSILRCHRKICECAVFTWTNLLVVVAELDGQENEAIDLVPLITNAVLEEHYLIVGVVVIVDPGVVPINSRGEKQRMHLRDGFLNDQLDPIYVSYNM